jgi:hypothetical protein
MRVAARACGSRRLPVAVLTAFMGGAIVLAIVSSAPAASRGPSEIDFGVRYTGHLTGFDGIKGTVDGKPYTSTSTEDVKFAAGCAGTFPKDEYCKLTWLMNGDVTQFDTEGHSCTFPVQLFPAYYKLNALTLGLYNPGGVRRDPLPAILGFGISPLPLVDLRYWNRRPGYAPYEGCRGLFTWVDTQRYASVGRINVDGGQRESRVRTVVRRTPPPDSRETGRTRFESLLVVTILSTSNSPNWLLDHAQDEIERWTDGFDEWLREHRVPTAIELNLPPTMHETSDSYSSDASITSGSTDAIRRTQVAAKTVKLFTIRQRIGHRPTRLRIHMTAAGKAALARLVRPATVHITSTLKSPAGRTTTRRYTFTVAPPAKMTAAAGGTISSVTFSGSPANPSFVIHGTKLGALPKTDPPGHPSGQNGCPAIAGDSGYDYGTNLYLAVPAKNWSAGRYRPSVNETDCLDLVVTKFAPTRVAFHFGPFYAKYVTAKLANGDAVDVAVNGAVKTVHVKYGATVGG